VLRNPITGISWLLRARRDRPRCRAAEQRDELAPSNVDCHATLPWVISCNGQGRYHAFIPRCTVNDRLGTLMSASARCRTYRRNDAIYEKAKTGRQCYSVVTAGFDR
jgi:hypothetical protein